MNHRESWALEVNAPSPQQWATFSASQGEDAVWPAPPTREKAKEEGPLPSGGFGGSSKSNSILRRKKT